ncbi:bifunctional aspartate kinase/homoserine dehydrogenase I [bacterium]|nr:bifunctional aspartate kinase/homoserine dehydrogenase I [bacterium]
MRILKFGGSSVATAERIQKVLKLISENSEQEKIVVVVSAFQDVTDKLIITGKNASNGDASYLESLTALKDRHHRTIRELIPNEATEFQKEIDSRFKELEDVLHGVYLIRELSLRTLDVIMSFGELFSARIITQAARFAGLNAEFLDTRTIIKTDSRFGSGHVLFDVSNSLIQRYFETNSALQIATGFIASTVREETTTLGRGGSDYTASILGAALNISEIQIWTDVNGVMTGDPNKVPRAFPIQAMTYEEAMEMSHFGAKIIHPPTMQPAMDQSIPIRIKNTFQPEFSGTIIGNVSIQSDYAIKGISSIPKISLLTVQGSGMIGIAGISSRLFGALARKGINVILITQASSEHSICIAVDPKQDEEAKNLIEEEFSLEIFARQVDPVILERDLSIMAVVGDDMRHTPGISGRIFQSLGNQCVNVVAVAQGSSERNISVVISSADESKALQAVHDTFFFPSSKTLSLFLAGPGLIGTTLLKQIQDQEPVLKKWNSIDLRIIGIANSGRMTENTEGIDLNSWKTLLESANEVMLPENLHSLLRRTGGTLAFVDCTASDTTHNLYSDLLSSGISIVTANKKALTGSWQQFLAINNAAESSGAGFLYEATVGAGLPVISTLKDLIATGDKIIKIEAILSGTLSYLFNRFDEKTRFSQLVAEARELGYTEPDPREDLNGADVGRKLLILARTIGWPMEMGDIEVQSLIPENAKNAPTAEEFLKLLAFEDAAFERMRAAAVNEGQVLRYIASLENGKAKVGLERVGSQHPFYLISRNDNVIAFTTSRYNKNPLVIRGPGAGAEVTAAGVFADILRLKV